MQLACIDFDFPPWKHQRGKQKCFFFPLPSPNVVWKPDDLGPMVIHQVILTAKQH